MIQKKEIVKQSTALSSGIFFIFLGLLFAFKTEFLWKSLYHIVSIGFFVFGILRFIQILIDKKQKKLLFAILNLALFWGLSFYIFLNPLTFIAFLPYVFGWWALLNSIILFMNFYFVYLKDNLNNKIWVLLEFLITFAFAILFISEPLLRINLFSFFIAAYFIFFGASDVIRFLHYNSRIKRPERLQHVFIPLPIFMTAFLPPKVVTKINQLIQDEQFIPVQPNTLACTSDLHVYIYLKDSGPESFGHIDIAFENKIYSYGCHDPHHRRLFGTLGDGVLIVCDRTSFIENAVQYENSTVIQFGILLNDKQKEVMRKRIEKLMQRTIEFKSDAQLEEEKNALEISAKDYLSRVYRRTKAKSFKFKKGLFKTYFVFTTNCVQLADYLLHMKELDLFKLNGIITPGTYFDFLNREYERVDSIIIEKNILKKYSSE